MKRPQGFTLVEILIVVVLLGVLAGAAISLAGNSGNEARASSLKAELQMLRRSMLIYKAHHLEVPPGYPNGDETQIPTEDAFVDQIIQATSVGGATAAPGTTGFPYGPYLMKMPTNPFNKKKTVQMVADGADFPADADDSHGWICKPETCEIRADCTGTDDDGVRYYDY